MALKSALTLFILFVPTSVFFASELKEEQCGSPVQQQSVLGSYRRMAAEKRIVGGKVAVHGSWPWMVMLIRHNKIECGGSILNSRYIVTAAHCFNNDINPRSWKVIVGKYRRNVEDDTEMVYTVSQIIPHENYRPQNVQNDIALMLLKENISFTDYVRPICLPPQNMTEDLKHMQCFTTGWGDTQVSGYSEKLREVRPMMLTTRECNRFLIRIKKYRFLRDKVFCAGHTGHDACYGDSGGPMSCKHEGNWYLKGIVSHGYYCGEPGWPGIYVDVRKYKDWIIKKMKGDI